MPKRAVFVVLCTFVTVGLAACGRATPGPTTVLIVRHGEKVSQDADTPLSDAGRARAVALADATSDAGVSAIYVSQFARNKDTARPLAERAGLAVSERPVNLSDPGDYGKRLAAEILEQQAGRTVVVVGHQNTIPLIVEGLTGRGAVPLGDAEYDRLTIVTIPPAGDAHVIVARYGAPSGT
jgi:broad specificity phosphatase PhoE